MIHDKSSDPETLSYCMLYNVDLISKVKKSTTLILQFYIGTEKINSEKQVKGAGGSSSKFSRN